MPRSGPLLSHAQWKKIAPLLPRSRKKPHGGRPRANDRKVLESILWILRSGARWQDLPDENPSPSTCWWRLRGWEGQDVWLNIWRAFLAELNERQQLKLEPHDSQVSLVSLWALRFRPAHMRVINRRSRRLLSPAPVAPH